MGAKGREKGGARCLTRSLLVRNSAAIMSVALLVIGAVLIGGGLSGRQ